MSSLVPSYSKFFYGYTIDETNYLLNFAEGAGPELEAVLNAGDYSFEDFAEEIKRAMDDAGALTYTVTANRSSRTLTVATTSTFSLLVSSGTNAGTSPFDLMGFTGSDRTAASTYTGDSESGFEFKPQFLLQNYISSDDWQQAADVSVNKIASGLVEVVKFGTEKFVQFQIRLQTEILQGCNSAIRTDADGVDNLRAFLQYVIRRSPLEFMPDETSPSTFQTIVMESSPDSNTGTGYKIKEMYDKNLPGYFETSVLKFRLRED